MSDVTQDYTDLQCFTSQELTPGCLRPQWVSSLTVAEEKQSLVLRHLNSNSNLNQTVFQQAKCLHCSQPLGLAGLEQFFRQWMTFCNSSHSPGYFQVFYFELSSLLIIYNHSKIMLVIICGFDWVHTSVTSINQCELLFINTGLKGNF